MKRETPAQILSAVFVDYDNIYLSLKRKNEEAAKRFAKDATGWLAEIESGRLMTATNRLPAEAQRRIVLNRCYGNPVPRRNQADNSTDMNSFPFVRHHFLRAGFEIVDCPPLTAQLKNSSDIRMVMDVRDYLHHDTYFDEFIILSGDADFTPVLHRLRAHARRTVVFANDFTAAPYIAIADAEIREADLITLLMGGKISSDARGTAAASANRPPIDSVRREIVAEITSAVRSAGQPVPLEALAERATRTLGHDKTVGTNWAGAGSFRELLLQSLPDGIRLSEQPPYVVFDAARQIGNESTTIPAARADHRIERTITGQQTAASPSRPVMGLPLTPGSAQIPQSAEPAPIKRTLLPQQAMPQPPLRTGQPLGAGITQPQIAAPPRDPALDTPAGSLQRAATPAVHSQTSRPADNATALQQSIARIHDACQAPPLSPPEYRTLFELMSLEISEQGLQGGQTLLNIASRAQDIGLDIRRDDIRFVLDVISEADPWFEQGASANLFAGRFRNFVVARCRSHGLTLTADEIDLIDAWFMGAGSQTSTAARQPAQAASPPQAGRSLTSAQHGPGGGDRWWMDDRTAPATEARGAGGRTVGAMGEPHGQGSYGSVSGDMGAGEEFPRIVRSRLRG